MALIEIDTAKWIKVSKYIKQRKLDRRTVMYWVKVGYLESKRIPSLDLILVRIGSEKEKAVPLVPIVSKSRTYVTPSLPSKRSAKNKKRA